MFLQIRGASLCVDASSYAIGRPATCRACNNRSITQVQQPPLTMTTCILNTSICSDKIVYLNLHFVCITEV